MYFAFVSIGAGSVHLHRRGRRGPTLAGTNAGDEKGHVCLLRLHAPTQGQGKQMVRSPRLPDARSFPR
jgi:hypothetical protein